MKNKYTLLVIITAFAIVPVFAVVQAAPSTGNGTTSGAPGTGGSTSSAASPTPAPSTGSSASSAGTGTTAPGTGGSTSSAASPSPSAPPTGGSTSSAASPSPSAPPTGGSTSSAGTPPSSGGTTSSAGSSAPATGGSTSSAASPTPTPSTAPGTGGSTSSADPVVAVTPTTPGGGGGGGGSYSSGGGSSSGGSSSSFVITNYCPLITTAMRMGANNNVIEVKNLQSFLRSTQGLNVDVTGIFDLKTENAVKAFQAKYSQDVLAPWGGTTPSGILVITTQKKINELACKKGMTLNAVELATINAYKKAHSGDTSIGSNNGVDLSGQSIISTTTSGSEVGVNGKTGENTAAVGNISLFQRFWNFLKSLF